MAWEISSRIMAAEHTQDETSGLRCASHGCYPPRRIQGDGHAKRNRRELRRIPAGRGPSRRVRGRRWVRPTGGRTRAPGGDAAARGLPAAGGSADAGRRAGRARDGSQRAPRSDRGDALAGPELVHRSRGAVSLAEPADAGGSGHRAECGPVHRLSRPLRGRFRAARLGPLQRSAPAVSPRTVHSTRSWGRPTGATARIHSGSRTSAGACPCTRATVRTGRSGWAPRGPDPGSPDLRHSSSAVASSSRP